MLQKENRPLIFFGWYIVAAGMLIQAFGYCARYSFSIFFPSLLTEFSWPRDMGATILSTHMLFYGFTAPVAGVVVDRIGSRKTMLGGMGLLSFGLLLSAWGQQAWHFHLAFGVFSGVGLCLLGAVPLTIVIRNWFERRRGIALCLISAGTGAAYACYPIVDWLVETLGWRYAYAVEAFAIVVVLGPIIYLVLIYHPREKGLYRDGLVREAGHSDAETQGDQLVVDKQWAVRDWSLPMAVKTYRFWLLCLITFSMWGVGKHIIVAHKIKFAMDIGFERSYASAILSLSGWMFSLGALAGLISDRIGREQTFTIGITITVSSMIALLMIRNPGHKWMLYYFSIAFGFGFGMCAPLVPAAITDIFQGSRVGGTIGCIWFSFSMGGTLGPWLGGLLFELTGTYRAAFITACVLCVLAGVAMWLTAPRKVRLVPGKIKAQREDRDFG